ncbi:MAG: aspartoacylase [Leptolyngbyaceae cyanobacterium MO_188.B28]|nr:aspartoacylase [Leptolyngbyaceae cyanobacterium MO_188.B28]
MGELSEWPASTQVYWYQASKSEIVIDPIVQPIRQVAIVGGTHGNEFTGAYLIKKFEQRPDLVKRSNFETLTLLGNPKAFDIARRYVDEDLNRCFLKQDLQDASRSSYEAMRAKTLNQILGPKDNARMDFLLDLHSTTANLGVTLILVNHHPFNLRLAAYLSKINPLIKVYCWSQPGHENAFLNSLCELGFAIEIGPVAQGVLDAAHFQTMEALIHSVLDYLEMCNQGDLIRTDNSLTLYQHVSVIDYPKDAQGDIRAMIHPQLQGRDYEPLHPGDPLFMGMDGASIMYQGESTVWPIFINEAAYYPKGIAMCLTQKQHIILSADEG